MITLNDPDTLNALDLSMRKELSDAMQQVKNNSYNVLILNGNGRSFSAGGNINSMVGITSAADASSRLDDLHDFILEMRKWKGIVIASVHGHSAGAGVN